MTAVWAAPKTSNIQPPRLTATGTRKQLVINVSLTLLWHMWKQQLCALQWQVPLIFTEVTFSFSLLEYYLFKRKHEWLSLKLQDGLNVTVNVTDWLIEIVHLDDWLNTFLSKQKWFSAFSVWYNCKWNLLVFWIVATTFEDVLSSDTLCGHLSSSSDRLNDYSVHWKHDH